MKKKSFALSTAMFAIILGACNNDELAMQQVSNHYPSDNVSTIWINDGLICNTRVETTDEKQLALRFKDFSSLENFKNKLNEVTDEEKLQIINNYGISTLHNIATIADEELEKIGNSASSESEFRMLYESYKQKYANYLITNYIDKTDLTLYVPDEDNIESYISNTNGFYVVGEQVIKANLNNQLSESITRLSKAAITPNSNTPVNTSVFSPKKKKKVYFDAYMVNVHMRVKMHCKKKMWYGWKNDPHRHYYFDPSLSSNFSFLSIGQSGQEIVVSPLPRYVFNNGVDNGFDIILGKINSGSSITGEIYTWTDMTSEHDANGNELTEVLNGLIVPKCLKSRAHVVRIDLKPQN